MSPSARQWTSSLWRNRYYLVATGSTIAIASTIFARNSETPWPMASSSSLSHYTSEVRTRGRTSAPDEAASNPHHVLKGDRVSGFKNPYPSYSNPTTFTRMLQNVVWPIITGDLKQPDTSHPDIPIVKPEWLPTRSASGKLRATWLGHACYYVEFPSGLRVLFDPVFEDRCSPVSFIGNKRYTKRPCDIEDIPIIDAVVISHSHYDHLSHTSVVNIQKNHPNVQFLVGLGLEKWFRRQGLKNVTELDWWEDADLTIEVGEEGEKKKSISAHISCLPSQHTSARTLLDRDTTLWCSWGVRSGEESVWFGGDTGYRAVPNLPGGMDDYGPDYEALPRCPQFKQIGELRGPFDLGLIPIGAYYPRHVFSAMHANPFDSVEIFQDTKCKKAMGIHWGTWALTMEEVLEPPRLLKEALERKGIPATGVFDVCDIGESREF